MTIFLSNCKAVLLQNRKCDSRCFPSTVFVRYSYSFYRFRSFFRNSFSRHVRANLYTLDRFFWINQGVARKNQSRSNIFLDERSFDDSTFYDSDRIFYRKGARKTSSISWLIMIVSIKDKLYDVNYMVTFSTTCILFGEDPGRTVLTYLNFAAHWRPTTTEQTLSFFGKYILTKTLSLTSRLIKRQTDRLIGEDAGRRVKAAVASLLVRNFLSDTRTNSEN